MALDNLISIDLTTEELSRIVTGLLEIEEALAGKIIALQPKERNKYGKVGEKTARWIQKIEDYTISHPHFVPEYMHLEEFRKDMAVRKAILPILLRMQALVIGLSDTALLIGTDLHSEASKFYHHIKLLAHQNVPGAKPIYDDLQQHFPGRPKLEKPKPE